MDSRKCKTISKSLRPAEPVDEPMITQKPDRKAFNEFLEITARKGMYNEVMTMVHSAEREIELNLERRRERLRKILSNEECSYEDQITSLHHQAVHEDMQTRLENLQRAENERELQRQKFVEQKRIQQHLLNCDELRQTIRQQLLRDSKQSQLKQIEDKQKLRDLKRDEERMWHEISRRVQSDLLAREDIEESMIQQRNACISRSLDEQITSKDNTSENKRTAEIERLANEKLLEQWKQSEEKRKAEEREKNRALSNDLEKQQEFKRILRDQERLREFQNEQELLAAIRNEQFNQCQVKTLEKKRQKEELDHYLKYIGQMRSDLQESKLEEISREYYEKANAELEAKLEDERKWKERVNKETYAIQKQQIEQRRRQKIEELQQKAQKQQELEDALQHHMRVEKAAIERKQREAADLAQDLQQQITLSARLKTEHAQQEAKINQDLQQIDEAYKNMTQTVLSTISQHVPLHPNHRVILNRNRDQRIDQ